MEYNIDWADEPIIGQTLITLNSSPGDPLRDSHGEPIDANQLYHVGKCRDTGMVAIEPVTQESPVETLFKDRLN